MLSQQPAKRGWLPLFGARNSACCLFFAEIVEDGPSAKWIVDYGLWLNGFSVVVVGQMACPLFFRQRRYSSKLGASPLPLL